MTWSATRWVAVLILFALEPTVSSAAEVRFFRTDSKAAFAQGTANAVSVGEWDELTLGSELTAVAAVEQPYVYSAAKTENGWVLGTGSEGVVVVVDKDGDTQALPALAEEHVFAVAVAKDGTIWAAGSPSGHLYRWQDPEWVSYAVHETDDLYVWALEPFEDGVYVATGAQGRVLKVHKDGLVEDLVGEIDTHVRSLHSLADGSLLAGTEGAGKVVRIVEGRAQVLYVSDAPEVTALTSDGSGTCYAATVSSQASWVAAAKQTVDATSSSEEATVTVSAVAANGNGSAAQTAIVRFACAGGVVEKFDAWGGETAYDLAVFSGQLWVATGQDGKVYRIDESGARFLEHDLEDKQAVSLIPAADHLAIVSSNGGAVMTVGDRRAQQGTFESAVFDAELNSRVGALTWSGEGEVEFSVRSGQTGTPDDGWPSWSAWRMGNSVDFTEMDAGRFLQWRARLHDNAKVHRVELAYRQANVAPRITELEVLAAGEVLVDASFNPGQQVFEPTRPTQDGIFTTLQPVTEKDGQRTKKLWKAGARTLRWKAEDDNKDPLAYRVEIQPEAGDWMIMAEDLDATFLTIDATVLPDGPYRFRVTADDSASNSSEEKLERSRISPLVILDQTPPELGEISRREGQLEVEIKDASSALRSIEISRDGEAWEAAKVADGAVDERSEQLIVDLGESAEFVIIRLTDWSFNRVVLSLPVG